MFVIHGLLIIANVVFLGVTWSMPGDGIQECPTWDPNGPVSFRRWTRELMAWLNLTSRRMGPNNQAAAIQLALRGVARELAFSIPPQHIQFGAQVNGIPTDPVTYILYIYIY